MPHDPADRRIDEIEETERRRCAALIERDFETLRGIVGDTYLHTHGNGRVENREEYFAFVEGPVQYRRIDRSDLIIRIFGSTAVMNGVLDAEAVISEEQDPMSIRVQIQQVWVEDKGTWRLVAYQGTSL